jgi:catechol 2,3-dioxygenase-like lactoylglutathione lyase family enzyme
MRVEHIFETVLYAGDLEAAERFYSRVLGLEAVQSSDIILAFRCGQGVLLLFDPEKSGEPGRSVPSHGAQGPGHVAFAVRDEEMESWRLQLAKNEIEIETEVEWNSGGRSIYFRDPAGNSVELVSPTLWGGGWEF